MTSLARRATPRQAMVMRMIVGAVKNAADSHPDWMVYNRRLANSIAKRAAGTLTAQWPDVLAAPMALSDSAGDSASKRQPSSAQIWKRMRRGPSRFTRRSPLLFAHNAIGALAKEARANSQVQREAALVDALRIIGGLLAIGKAG